MGLSLLLQVRNKQGLQRSGRVIIFKSWKSCINDCSDWLILGHQSVNPFREAIPILSGKYKRFTFVHPVSLWSIICVYRELKQTDAAAANLQISMQKDSRPSEFSRPVTSITLNLNRDLPVDSRRVSCLSSLIIIEEMSFYFRKHYWMVDKSVPRNHISAARWWTTTHVLQKWLSICTHTVVITILSAWADRAELQYSGKILIQKLPALSWNYQSFVDCSMERPKKY